MKDYKVKKIDIICYNPRSHRPRRITLSIGVVGTVVNDSPRRLMLVAVHDHIQHDCADDDQTFDDGLIIGRYADHIHAVVDQSDNEDTKHTARNRCNAAGE